MSAAIVMPSPAASARPLRLSSRVLAAVAGLLVWIGYVVCAATLLGDRLARHMASVRTAFVPSDFFVPWLGAKTLISGHNPYTAEFADQLHRVFYGMVVQSSPEFQNPAAFAYPPYVAVVLLPFLWLPFEVVRPLSVVGLAASLAASAVLWLRLVRPGASRSMAVFAAVGALTFFPSLVLLWLQQLTGLVVALLVGAAVLAAHRRYVLAGACLALCLIKPPLVVLPIAAVAVWSLARRERWPLLGSFLGVSVALLLFAQIALPTWIADLLAATDRYRSLNTMFWLPAKVAGPVGGALLAVLAVAALAALWWRSRARSFADLTSLYALTCASAVVLTPDVSFYNRALLIPSLVSLACAGAGAVRLRRVTFKLAVLAVAAPVALMAATTLLQILQIDPSYAGPLLEASEASFVVMPLLLVPALAALSLDRRSGARASSASHTPRRRPAVRPALRAVVGLCFVALATAYLHLSGEAVFGRLLPAFEQNGGTFFPSDLFQPWFAGRALLAGVDPYTDQFASQLHQIFFGVPLHSGPGAHPEIRFFYPPFVVALMAPFLALPFEAARWSSAAALAFSLAAAAWAWATVSGLTPWRRAGAVLASLLFLPSLEIVGIQQLSGFAIFFLIAGCAAAARGRFVAAGVLLGLSLFKPQLAAIPVAPLLLWSLWRRDRWPLWIAFGITAAAQLTFATLLLPTWLASFLEGTRSYQNTNDAAWLPGVVAGSRAGGIALTSLLLLATAWIWWRCRDAVAGSGIWLAAVALTLVVRACVMPDVSYYNRALLIAPLITIACPLAGAGLVHRTAHRFALVTAALPFLVLGCVGVAGWLGAPAGAAGAAVSSVEVLILMLPLLLLPAAFTACASGLRPRDPLSRLSAGVAAAC